MRELRQKQLVTESIHSHLRRRAQEAAGSVGDGNSGVAESDVGWRCAGARSWAAPDLAEQTGLIRKS